MRRDWKLGEVDLPCSHHLTLSSHIASPCLAHIASPCPAHITSPCPAHIASPCPAHIASLCPAHITPPCPAHITSHIASPCSAHIASNIASHITSPCRGRVWSAGWVCTVRDKKPGKDSIPNPSFVNIFSLAEMRLDLPCMLV